MVNNIVEYTNDVIRPVVERFSDDVLDASTKYTHFCIVDHMNIRASLGILYLRGALRMNLMSTSTATMSHIHFKLINRFITLDDKASRKEHWKTDKFACMRDLFELMNGDNAKCRYP